MDEWPPHIAAVHDRQDAERCLPAPRGEAAIRAEQRQWVRDLLNYTTRGNRGATKTDLSILQDIRWARLAHTASIRREQC